MVTNWELTLLGGAAGAATADDPLVGGAVGAVGGGVLGPLGDFGVEFAGGLGLASTSAGGAYVTTAAYNAIEDNPTLQGTEKAMVTAFFAPYLSLEAPLSTLIAAENSEILSSTYASVSALAGVVLDKLGTGLGNEHATCNPPTQSGP
jgi:hypothetical protein